jgi:hypothetical protein
MSYLKDLETEAEILQDMFDPSLVIAAIVITTGYALIHAIEQFHLSAEYNFALRNIYFWIPNFKYETVKLRK